MAAFLRVDGDLCDCWEVSPRDAGLEAPDEGPGTARALPASVYPPT